MEKHKVVFLTYNKEIIVEDGANLLQAALEAGVHINASCGGEGVCGKCRVLIEQGEVEGGYTLKLGQKDFDKGYRQACLSHVKSDLAVRILTESVIDASVLNILVVPRRTARDQEMDLNEIKEGGMFVLPVEKKYLELPRPSAQNNVSDVTRITNDLELNHSEHQLEVDFSVFRKIPNILREQDFKVTVTLARPINEKNRTRIINVQPGKRSNNYAIAIDVGTTTIYGQLVDLLTGAAIAQHGDFNGQISYGEDVISRIIYAEKPEGLEKLHDVVIKTINDIIERIVKRAKIESGEISAVTFAGNTTMAQLLLKITPWSIRRAPYIPTSTFYPSVRAVDLGLKVGGHVPALVFPNVSSYVGGDIVAGVIGSGMHRADELTLFMDIGTNAEIVVGNKDWLICAACSAGPAFEGGGIEHGMRATKGAIEDFSMDPISLEPMNITIGHVRPKGICGSGLITIVATLFEMGLIDQGGKFNRELKSPRLRENEGIYEYVLARAEETRIDRDVVLTELDIENFIRAKGAMYAGCITLLNEVGLNIQQLDRIILAGGFGGHIDLDKAMAIGLLPETDPEKVMFMGNGSLMGARMCLLSNRIRKEVVEVTKSMTNLELSETGSYMDNYMAALFLPCTDLNLFPRLKSRLDARSALQKSPCAAGIHKSAEVPETKR